MMKNMKLAFLAMSLMASSFGIANVDELKKSDIYDWAKAGAFHASKEFPCLSDRVLRIGFMVMMTTESTVTELTHDIIKARKDLALLDDQSQASNIFNAKGRLDSFESEINAIRSVRRHFDEAQF